MLTKKIPERDKPRSEFRVHADSPRPIHRPSAKPGLPKPRRLKPADEILVNEELRTGRPAPRVRIEIGIVGSKSKNGGDDPLPQKCRDQGTQKPETRNREPQAPFRVPRSRGFSKADSSAVSGTWASKPRRLKPADEILVNEELRTGRPPPPVRNRNRDLNRNRKMEETTHYHKSAEITRKPETRNQKQAPFRVPRSRGFSKADSSAVRGTWASKPRRLKPADEILVNEELRTGRPPPPLRNRNRNLNRNRKMEETTHYHKSAEIKVTRNKKQETIPVQSSAFTRILQGRFIGRPRNLGSEAASAEACG